ncbi:hypothetical protein Q5P01_016439 [Channa striata]|uniref:Uncharacterized protein n=1 Tax=Channa striata TaxID=64152 RepID=A0AA88MDM8_CHASR|nr:hypothetical protein Q5P01_016439 [Channa striata]
MQPAESSLMEFSRQTRNSPLPVCHLLDEGCYKTEERRLTFFLLEGVRHDGICSGIQVFWKRRPSSAVPKVSEMNRPKQDQELTTAECVWQFLESEISTYSRSLCFWSYIEIPHSQRGEKGSDLVHSIN